jgi:FixJ family two-component response regulator
MIPPSTVFIVDDDPNVLRALSRLLRAEGLEARPYQSPQLFLKEHDPTIPGCLVLDMAMPGMSGLDLQQALSLPDWQRPIVFLSGRGDVPSTVKAMKAGAVDFLTKPVNGKDLLAAVGRANAQDLQARRERTELLAILRKLATLTPRERQVMDHVVAGELNKQIAAELGTVEKTIKVHRARVMLKMGVRSVAELVRLTERVGPGSASARNLSA